MGITADCELDALWDIGLDHCRLIIYNIPYGDDDLVGVFLVNVFSILESFRHIVNEFLGHLLAQPDTII